MIFRSFLLPGISRKRKLSRNLKQKAGSRYLCRSTKYRMIFPQRFQEKSETTGSMKILSLQVKSSVSNRTSRRSGF